MNTELMNTFYIVLICNTFVPITPVGATSTGPSLGDFGTM